MKRPRVGQHRELKPRRAQMGHPLGSVVPIIHERRVEGRQLLAVRHDEKRLLSRVVPAGQRREWHVCGDGVPVGRRVLLLLRNRWKTHVHALVAQVLTPSETQTPNQGFLCHPRIDLHAVSQTRFSALTSIHTLPTNRTAVNRSRFQTRGRWQRSGSCAGMERAATRRSLGDLLEMRGTCGKDGRE